MRYNPYGDAATNARQRTDCSTCRPSPRALRRRVPAGLLVPPEPAQRAEDYDIATRPELVVRAIDELREADIQPDLWKIEGLDRREDCATVAEHAGAPCVVLGRGADADAVERWLRAGAGIFDGFAIGQIDTGGTPLAPTSTVAADRDATVSAIAERYGHFVDVFRDAANWRSHPPALLAWTDAADSGVKMPPRSRGCSCSSGSRSPRSSRSSRCTWSGTTGSMRRRSGS